MSKLHAPPEDALQVYRWYRRSQVDYVGHFIELYVAYNAWYRKATGSTNDREAIGKLKKRFVIWDDYANGATMPAMKLYMEKVVEHSSERPLPGGSYWDGRVLSTEDWRGLLEYWYQIRCLLVHGETVPSRHVWLAYETLDIFMNEIIDRMQRCFTEKDMERLKEVSALAVADHDRSEKFKTLQRKLHEKYIASPNIWRVDMERA